MCNRILLSDADFKGMCHCCFWFFTWREMCKEERHVEAHTTAAFISLGLRIVVLLALGSGP